ncbi:hypothetical protein CYLTODRAFT_388608 [Cylindrobasidium torrendii FP15055 ss-10]|uniref:BTB domain-containing protein n=1 Tax=Cylindrobasidium torrendii FP15055 ss-10 TaxID=1314674 RepID=A0A0D7BQR0_9AGAR|nr:hypothetical protein CYLTODRAFT_388608 [Cylindrobasidium torrendii FP15055 ss-10]
MSGSLDFVRGEPWMEDGNIVLLTEDNPPTAFRVHRSVLARQSEIFQDMFNFPHSNDSNLFEGCPIIPMPDIPEDLSNLVRALYDGPSFQNESILDFFYVAGILRLSTKYFIANLRQQAINHLSRTWAHTLHGHDEMVETALTTPNVNKLTYPFVHPLHVLNLARETHVRSIIPSVFYFLSLYRLEDLLKADHHKLRYEHPSKPSSELSPYDLRIYTMMFQKRIEETMIFLRTICGERESPAECTRKSDCLRTFDKLAARLTRTWAVRTALMYYVVQVQREAGQNDLCNHCLRAFQADCEKFRARLWAEFPGICDLPPWEQLVQEELTDSRLRRRS